MSKVVRHRESRRIAWRYGDATTSPNDISGAKPKPGIGRAVWLRGTKLSKLGVCQQGIILDDIRWSYTEGKCR
jgi:hypothetical protein